QRLSGSIVPPQMLIDRLALSDIDPIERQALLLAWAEARPTAISIPGYSALIETAQRIYRDNPHPGVHSAAELFLRRHGGADMQGTRESPLPSGQVGNDHVGWQRGPNGHTFAILPGPLEFRMGAPESEPAHYHKPVVHYRKIERSLAVAMKEV